MSAILPQSCIILDFFPSVSTVQYNTVQYNTVYEFKRGKYYAYGYYDIMDIMILWMLWMLWIGGSDPLHIDI